MFINSLFGRKSSDSSANSTSCKGVKLNKKNHQPRRMMLEPLESRDLLTVTTGSIDDAEYSQIRAQYPEFELPELQADLNVMTITPDDGALSLSDLKSAIADAGTTTQPDLILVRTSARANSVTYASNADEISINIDSTQYGSVTILGWGEENFTLDANQKSRVMSIQGSSNVVNLGGLTITGGDSSSSLSNTSAGGGICNNSATLTITNSTISGNTAEYGGGIYNTGTLTVTNSTISGNITDYGGGGIHNCCLRNGRATLIITNSTISGNTGDGICNLPGLNGNNSVLSITNCTILGNTGHGIRNRSFSWITNCTISGNTGYGIDTATRSNTTNNSIISRNYGGNVDGNLSSNSSNNLIGGYYPGFITPPQFDSEGKLTNADTMDLHLRSDSIAIDKGDNTAVENLETDIEGSTRIYGEAVDIGAYEYQGDRNDEPIPYSTIVNTLNDSFDLNDDEWSLREAIYYAPEYVTITFTDELEGTIVLSLGQLIIENALAIDGDNRITIDADQKSRVLLVNAGTESNPIKLENLTIQNGTAENGGGICIESGYLTITNSTISGNTASSSGGGIYNDSGRLTITNSTISGNTAVSSGGGIYNENDGAQTVTNSIISRNYGGNVEGNLSSNSSNNLIGGYYPGFITPPQFDSEGKLTNADTLDLHLRSDSIAIDKGDNTAVNNIEKDIDGNARINGDTVDIGAYEYQGDRNDEPYSTVVNTLNDSFELNDGEWSLREAIYYAQEYVTITFADDLEGTIVLLLGELDIEAPLAIDGDNRITIDADQKSRVFYISGGTEESPVVLNGLSIQNGNASNGGGIYNSSGTLTITNSTISGNTASSYGGGICNSSGTLTITNSTIAGNTASSYGGGICNSYDTTNIYNTIVAANTASNGTDVYKSSGGSINAYNSLSSYTAWNNGSDNIVYDPNQQLFVDAENGDHRLVKGSQAIDKGSNQYAYNAGLDEFSTDIIGVSRFIGNNIDIGAYEYFGINSSQDGIYIGNVTVSWTQYKNTANVRLTWVSGASKTVLGTLASVGNYTWDTTAFADGYGQLTVEYLDKNGSAILSSTVTGLILNDDSVVVHRGDVSAPETWSADKVHLVAGRLDVLSGGSVTVAQNAVVKFWKNAYISTKSGSALTVEDNVVFTRAEDDSVVGDTNLDGELSKPQYGNAYIRGTGTLNLSPSLTMKYVTTTTSGTISSDQTWLAGQVYRVTGDVTVASGATLTIQPGAIVKFNSGKSLIVQSGGTLNAQGTVAQPIVFTSVKDDEYGGDTNEDDGFYSPAAGDWNQIKVLGTANFDHAVIRYTGAVSGSNGAIYGENGSVVNFNNSVMEFSKYYAFSFNGGTLRAVNSVFREGQTALINMHSTSCNARFVNCTFADSSMFLWCGWGNTSFINCIAANITNTFVGLSNSASFQNCVFYNPKSSGPQSFSFVGSNGNAWANPLFRNASAGDYYLMAGSPCIDAGTSDGAPETDITGAPRANDPYSGREGVVDIGAYEFVDGVVSAIDLEPVNVQAPSSVTTGDAATIQWTIRNNGSASVTGTWADVIYLVNESSGQSILVKEYAHAGDIAPGDLQTFYADVVVPNAADGTWKIQIHVNPNRDIFEGVNIDNNKVISAPIEVSCPVWTLGSTTIHLDSTQILRKIVQSAGSPLLIQAQCAKESKIQVSIDGGLTYQTAAADCDGLYTFYAPSCEEIRTVYVKAESSEYCKAQLNISDEPIALIGVSTHSVVQGVTTLQVFGGGFESGMSLSLHSDASVIKASPVYIESVSSAVATFDLSEAMAGNYDLILNVNGQTRTLSNAITVSATKNGAKLEYDIQFPDSMRAGRTYLCKITYKNSGDCDMYAPIIYIKAETASLGISSDDTNLSALHLIGAGSSGSAGILRAGESRMLVFYYTANNGNNTVSIATGDTDAELSAAITRWDLRGNAVNHAGTIYTFVNAINNGEDVSCVSGRLLDIKSKGAISGAAILAEWINSADETESVIAYTDSAGRYVFNYLPEGVDVTLSIFSGTGSYMPVTVRTTNDDITNCDILANRYNYISGKVIGTDGLLKKDVLVTAENATGEIQSTYTDKYGSFTFTDIGTGTWTLSVNCNGRFKSSESVDVSLFNGQDATGVKLVVDQGAGLSGVVVNSSGESIEQATVMITDSQGVCYSCTTDEDGKYSLSGFNEGEAQISIYSDDYARITQSVELVSGISTMNFQCVAGLTVSGIVTNSDGSMFDSGFITLMDDKGESYSGIASEGAFSVSCLTPGTYTLTVMSSSYEVLHSSEITIVQGDEISNINIVLSSNGTISGVIKSNGMNVSGLSLALYQNEEIIAITTTKFDGSYSFTDIERGDYVLKPINSDVSESVTINDQNLVVIQNIDLDFFACVTGFVTLPEGVSSADVYIYYYDEQSEEYSLVNNSKTNSNGATRFWINQPGRYRFNASCDKGIFIPREVIIDASQNEATFNLDNLGTARAVITFNGLIPAEDQLVFYSLMHLSESESTDDQNFSEHYAETLSNYSDDISGLTFENLQPGKYTLNVSYGNYTAKTEFTLVQENSSAIIDIDFNEVYSLTVNMIYPDDDTDFDYENAIGYLYDSGNVLVSIVFANEDGQLTFNNIPSGEYTLTMFNEEYAIKATLSINDHNESASVIMDHAPVTITGIITLDGADISDADVSILNEDGEVIGIGVIGQDGSFIAYCLDSDSYTLEVCTDTSTVFTKDWGNVSESEINLGVIEFSFENASVPEAQVIFVNVVDYDEPEAMEGFWDWVVKIVGDKDLEKMGERVDSLIAKLNNQKSYKLCDCLCTDMQAYYKYINDYEQLRGISNNIVAEMNKLQGQLEDYNSSIEKASTSGKNLIWKITFETLFAAGRALPIVKHVVTFTELLKDIGDVYSGVAKLVSLANDFNKTFKDFLTEFRKGVTSITTGSVSLMNKYSSFQDFCLKTKIDQLESIRNIFNKESDYAYNFYLQQNKNKLGSRRTTKKLLKELNYITKILDWVLTIRDTINDFNDMFNKYDQQQQTTHHINFLLQKAETINPQIGSLCTCTICHCNDQFDDDLDDYSSQIPQSCDPNEIIGPVGGDFVTHDEGTEDEPFMVIDGANWITNNPNQENEYKIYFENKSTATAAAQEIYVSTALPAEMDWDSFQVDAISIGNEIYTLTDDCLIGENTWLVNQSSTGEQIKIRYSIDSQTGEVLWYLRSYVASTADNFPASAYDGFLPPNDDNHSGEGYIAYRVKYDSDLTTGDVVSTSATIVFDTNEPIETNVWLNTIDVDIPFVQMDNAERAGDAIALAWSGSDVGSGIEHYQIYVSADGGAYTLWQSFESDVTSAIFDSQTPGEYSFYILAVDGAGNIGGDLEQATPSILIESDMEMRVVTTSAVHASTDVISDNLETITDWDAFYMEFWTTNLKESQAGKTSTAKILYDSNVFQLDANQAIAAPAGITAEISDPILESNGMTSVIVTFTVGEDGYTAPGANTYWGAVHFTPNMQDGAGIQNPLESESLDVEMGGAASGTTVKAMPYDLNRDGKVNVDDFILFATVYGTNTDSVSTNDGMYTEKLLSDYDGDGAVNATDFIAFATNYGLVKGDGKNVTLPQQNPQTNGSSVPNNSTVSESNLVEQLDTYAQPEPAASPIQQASEQVVAVQSASLIYEIAVESELKSAVQVLRQAHSSALLDLYDNQNQSDAPAALSAKAIDESIIIDDDSFDFLFDESDSDADDSSDVDLSAVLDELELELI